MYSSSQQLHETKLTASFSVHIYLVVSILLLYYQAPTRCKDKKTSCYIKMCQPSHLNLVLRLLILHQALCFIVERKRCLHSVSSLSDPDGILAPQYLCLSAIIQSNSTLIHEIDDDRIKYGQISYKLTSPREWLEYMEARYSSEGAYTVIRCDVHRSQSNDTFVTLWGLDFHLNRISRSFESIVDDSLDFPFETSKEIALKESRQIISSFADHLTKASPEFYSEAAEKDEIKTSMITIVWHKIGHQIATQGHLYSTNSIFNPNHYNPNVITAAIAHFDSKLPSRYNHHPHAKLSSWCRLRRTLEDSFKTEGIGEVILTKKCSSSDDLELLEGLTSNLFIIYRDGSIRTPTSNVLRGYSQFLILNAASELGFTIVDEPITVKDVFSDLWAEAFVSSSINLIRPVGRILYQRDHLAFEWNEVPLSDLNWKFRKWKELYQAVIGKVSHTQS